MAKRERSYTHDDPKLNKELERVTGSIRKVEEEAKKQRSVVTTDKINDKIPEGIFHVDKKTGDVYIKTKQGLKQIQFV